MGVAVEERQDGVVEANQADQDHMQQWFVIRWEQVSSKIMGRA